MTILRVLTPQTLENRAALRNAIGALVAVLIAFALHLDKPYWSGMTVVILANVYTGSIIDKAIMRIVGTVIGAASGYFIAGLVANSLVLYLLSCFFFVAIAVYYYNFSVYAYGYLLAALSAFIVIAQLAVDPGSAYLVAIWRPIEIGLGVLVSAATAFCLFPNNIQDSFYKEVDQVFDGMNSLIGQLKKALLTDEVSFVQISQSNLALKKRLRKATEMIGFIRRELGFKRQKLDQFRVLLDLFYSLSRIINYFISSYNLQQKSTISFLSEAILDVFNAIDQDLHYLKKAFFEKNDGQPDLQTTKAMENFNKAVVEYTQGDIEKVRASFEIERLLQQVAVIVENLGRILIQQSSLPSKRKLISSQEWLRSDSDIMIHGVKAGLSAVLALCFWLISNWPGGINGIISSIVISIRKNLFEMQNISLHRILGCLFGGGLALGTLAYFAMNLYEFILIIFFGVWAFSYFSFKYTDYAYIGLQANIALIISMAQAGGSPTNLAPPLERLGGIFIGIIASFLIANILWRTDLFTMLARRLKKLLQLLVHNIKQALLGSNRPMYDLVNLFWLCRGLIEQLESEKLSAAKKEKLEQAKKNFEHFVLVQATLSHIVCSLDREKAHNTAEILAIDLGRLELNIIELYQGHPGIYQIIKQQIETMTVKINTIHDENIKRDELINCLGYINSLQQLVTLASASAMELPSPQEESSGFIIPTNV